MPKETPYVYEYREYPRHLHKVGGDFVVVANEQESDAAQADGWALEPPSEPAPEPTPEPVKARKAK